MQIALLSPSSLRFSPIAECRPPRAGIGPFMFWCGASGRRHIVTVYDFDDCPEIADAVAFAVRREADGGRRVLAVAELAAWPALALRGTAFAAARAQGATEIHLHLLAGTRAARLGLVADVVGDAAAAETALRGAVALA